MRLKKFWGVEVYLNGLMFLVLTIY